jgi:hypothetical protein
MSAMAIQGVKLPNKISSGEIGTVFIKGELAEPLSLKLERQFCLGELSVFIPYEVA